ncbi:hypothetical protein AAY55_16980 [Vibrio metoecus]|uniref:Uncharacterized protein n=1 Tax=Vibrio metoecus TaxID=1481663 RepID=A0A0Q0KG09_VIBMT|nr:hypothetical protein AAY55_16980 [Vibrio metoecus]
MTFLTHLFADHFTKMHQTNTRPTPKAVKLAAKTTKRSMLSWPRLRLRDKENQITAMMQLLCETKLTVFEHPTTLNNRSLLVISDCETTELSTLYYQISIKKTPNAKLCSLNAKC